jgi:hypothetical protein
MASCKTLKGGRKKGNGHKMNCGCPICKNMRKSKKRGGNEISNSVEDAAIADAFVKDDAIVYDNNKLIEMQGGKRKHKISSKKRGNGHKMNCGCPICKNMRKSKKHGGGDDEDEKGDDDEDDEAEIIEDEDENASKSENASKVEDEDENEDKDEDEITKGGKKSKSKCGKGGKGKKTKRRSSRRKGKKSKRRSHRRK